MNHRGHESPMDFQWENTSGRMDPNSPFRVTGIENTNPSPPNTPLRKSECARPDLDWCPLDLLN
jgi:hypothetical protein